MLRKVFLFVLLLSPLVVRGQLLSVTATLTDPDGTLWVNAICSVQIYSPNGAPFFGVTPVPTAPQACSVDGSGVLSTSIYNTSTLTPIGTQYRFNINSATSAPGSSFLTPITSANMTGALSALLVRPRFDASKAFAYGYADVEAITGTPGGQYYNTVTPAQRIWSGSAWTAAGGGGGGSVGATNFIQKVGATAGSFAQSSISDNGTTINFGLPLNPINFGSLFGTAAVTLFDGGATSRLGWGLASSEMQFFIATGNHFSWNIGGDLQPSGTNEIMRLTTAGLLSVKSLALTAATTATSATAGAATALPATPASYVSVLINGTNLKIPLYAQ